MLSCGAFFLEPQVFVRWSVRNSQDSDAEQERQSLYVCTQRYARHLFRSAKLLNLAEHMLVYAEPLRKTHLEQKNRLHGAQPGPDSLETMLSLLDMEAYGEEHAAALGFGRAAAPRVPEAPRM